MAIVKWGESLEGLHGVVSILTGITWTPQVGDVPGYVRWRMGASTYTIREDPSDGYRSYAEDLRVDDGGPIETEIPPTIVRCKYDGNTRDNTRDILRIIDVETGKPVLEVGTDNAHDYYPSCVMNWMPENLAVNALPGPALVKAHRSRGIPPLK